MASVLLRNAVRLRLACRHSKSIRITGSTSDERFIMTGRTRSEKVLEELQKNPYYDKYAEKIAKLQQTSPEEFLQRVEQQEKTREKREKHERAGKFYQAEAKPVVESGIQAKEIQLNKIMKIDMIKDKSKEEIIEIWKEYHKQKDCICGAIAPEQYDKMFARGKQYSTFLLPLPRDHGYEFIMCQFYGSEIHMTPLVWYQTHKENAPECLTMIHYTELRDDKGIILMRGEFDTKLLGVQEAQCLANELQLYYCTDNEHRLQLLETFTHKPNEFKHMDLIAQLETISLEPSTIEENK